MRMTLEFNNDDAVTTPAKFKQVHPDSEATIESQYPHLNLSEGTLVGRIQNPGRRCNRYNLDSQNPLDRPFRTFFLPSGFFKMG